MSSKYSNIKTATELVNEVMVRGLSLDTDDLIRAQDIIGHSSIEELARLANDIGRNNADGEPDPNGSFSSNRPATQNTMYMILFQIWNWEDAVRFWNTHTNPEHKHNKELREKLKSEMTEHAKTKEALKQQKISTDAEHKFLQIERGNSSEKAEKIRSLEAEIHDRDMTIMELKAKLYDMMTAKVKK